MKFFDRVTIHTKHTTKAACIEWLATAGVSAAESDIISGIETYAHSPYRYCDIVVRHLHDQQRRDRLSSAYNRLRPGEEPLAFELQVDYSQADLLSASLCTCAMQRMMKVRSGSAYGTQYDWGNACEFCGVGRRQIGPLIAKRSLLSKKQKLTVSWDADWIVSSVLSGAIVTEIDGGEACINSVIDNQTRESFGYGQLVPLAELPPWDAATTGIAIDERDPRRCRVCCRSGFRGVAGELFMPVVDASKIDLGTIPPIMESFEKWEYSDVKGTLHGCPFVARGDMVLRRDVVALFLKLKVRGMNLSPVRVFNQ